MGCDAVSKGKQFPTSERITIPQYVKTIHPVKQCYSPDDSNIQ